MKIQQSILPLPTTAKFASIALLFILACKPSPEVSSPEKLPFSPADFLEKSPAETFDFAQKLPAAQQDSLYFPLFSALADDNKNSLKIEHIDQYEKLRGGDPAAQMRATASRGEALIFLGNYDSAIVLENRVLAFAEQQGNAKLIAEAAYPLGMAYRLQGDYAKCTEKYLRAMQAAATLGDSTLFNTIQVEQAAVLFLTNDFDAAIRTANLAQFWFEKKRDTAMLGYLNTICGLAFAEKRDLENALQNHEKSLAYRRAIGDERDIAESLNNIAIVYRKSKNWQKAAESFETALPMMERAQDYRNVGIIRGNLGMCYQKMGRTADAIRCFEQSAKEQKARGQLPDAAANVGRLAQIHAAGGDFKNAFQFLEEKHALLDSVFQREKSRDINELNVRFETAQKEHQIASLQAQKRADRLLLGLAILGVLMLSGAAGFLFYRLRQKQKLLEKEEQIRAAREQAHQKELEKNELELEFHRRELEGFASRLAEKNRLVETLHHNLDALKNDLASRPSSDQEPPPLEALYQMRILTDEDWAEFRSKFERVFPGFMADLRTKFKDITEAELRLAMMLRMDIRPREIAAMLGVSPDSVGKTRYRLRKKMGLTEEDNLEAFLLGR